MDDSKQDMVTRIVLDYHRVTKITPKQKAEGDTFDYAIWDYTEHLIIDRETEIIELIQDVGTGCKISHKYEVENGADYLLNCFDIENMLSNINDNSDDVIETPNESKTYKITIYYKEAPKRVAEGNYDKYGLPEGFAYFAETVFDFIGLYGMGEILNPSVYGKVRRRQSEYIFCSVIFEDGYKSYYYLTDDDNIEVDDFVLVPAGKDNHEAIVRVVKIEYFDVANAPMPIEKTKRIIRKCTDEDFELYEE